MKFIRDLLGKKRKEASDVSSASVETLEQSYRDTIGTIVDETNALTAEPAAPEAAPEPAAAAPTPAPRRVKPKAPKAETPVNIWDLEDGGASSELSVPPPLLPNYRIFATLRDIPSMYFCGDFCRVTRSVKNGDIADATFACQ